MNEKRSLYGDLFSYSSVCDVTRLGLEPKTPSLKGMCSTY